MMNTPTRVTYIGNFERDWNTELHLARDLRAIGCDVELVDERDVATALKTIGPIEMELPREGTQLVLYTKTHGLPHHARSLWTRLEQLGIKTASFHLDLYVGLKRESEIGVDPFWRTGTVFTADGDPASQLVFAAAGVNHRWCPPAVVSDETRRFIPQDGFWPYVGVNDETQVVFVGSSRSYHAEWPFRLNMLRELKRRYGKRFQVLGPPDEVIRGFALNQLYQRPSENGLIVVGDSLCLPGHSRYFSDRYFETVGRGGFLVAPRVPGIEDFLDDGNHFIGYEPGDLSSLFERVDEYLEEPATQRIIAETGARHVARTQTYQQRAQLILEAVGLSS